MISMTSSWKAGEKQKMSLIVYVISSVNMMLRRSMISMISLVSRASSRTTSGDGMTSDRPASEPSGEVIFSIFLGLSQSVDVSIEQMRQYLLSRYPNSKTWPEKVKKMHDGQVYTVYIALKQRES